MDESARFGYSFYYISEVRGHMTLMQSGCGYTNQFPAFRFTTIVVSFAVFFIVFRPLLE